MASLPNELFICTLISLAFPFMTSLEKLADGHPKNRCWPARAHVARSQTETE